MPSVIIPNAARQMRKELAKRRYQWKRRQHEIECKLEEIEDEIVRLTELISSYDEIERQERGPVDLCHEPLEHNGPETSTTENVTFIERVKQMVLLHPGKSSEIAMHLGKSARDISKRLTILADRGEIAHWPECHMWGPIEWTPPTNGEQSNA